MTDKEIIERILQGEKSLYEKLIRKYDQRLFRISMSIINDVAEARDIMQNTYLNAYLQLPSLQNKSNFGTWIIKILVNESLLRKKRKLKQRQAFNKQSGNEMETPLKSLLNKELRALLEKVIAELPEKYKLVFVMREIEEMSTHETMDVLNLSESNVKARLSRAKEMLREKITGKKLKDLFKLKLPVCNRIVQYVMDRIKNVQKDDVHK
ncbi:MAG: sigma-70 family RNA polymerase sigma factor [Ginsengibacter sp.]